MNCYIVEGGIGKAIAFTSIVDALAEKDGGEICVSTPYPDIFGGNPKIKWVFDSTTIPLTDQRIQDCKDIIFCEPYKSNFQKGKEHLIESYCILLGVEYKKTMRPIIYSDHVKAQSQEALKKAEIKGQYFIVQFSGGQPPMNNMQNMYQSGDPGRNYPPFFANTIIEGLRRAYPKIEIINYTLPNEPHYEGTKKIQIPYILYHELLKNCEGFISIDSSLQHFAMSAKARGVVIWGSTRWSQFGYPELRNINYHMETTWDESKFHPQNPINIMVDPNHVLNTFKKIRKKEK